ncbi:MAG: tetratricopeptide repeat protein [Candidatus Koribacter versatilis]|uniref:Tetratricopeptide repeat protein n=1 Tax=Candidatus Korobacter versatilis TaxID=658062 RepID=A0A932A811_9BACT|nr:tetratricopeptide repeat protein [Candidatus Koribacter versatilis]
MKKFLFILVMCAGLATGAFGVGAGAKEALKAGRMDEAIRLLRAATQERANDAEAWHLLSKAYLALERWDDAVKAAEKASSLEPNNSDYHLWLGRAYGNKAENSPFWTAWGMAKKVRQEFEKAVAINANNVDARSDLAEFYVEAPSMLGGGKDKAAAEADRLAANDADAAHWVRGYLAEKDKDYGTAEREYLAAVQSSGNQAGRWLDVASFYRRSGQKSKMEAAVNSAIAAEKKSDGTLYEAASILFRAGRNFTLAAKLLRNYLKNPASDEAPAFKAHYLLGEILEKQGDKLGAAAEYQSSVELAHDFQGAQTALKRVRGQ